MKCWLFGGMLLEVMVNMLGFDDVINLIGNVIGNAGLFRRLVSRCSPRCFISSLRMIYWRALCWLVFRMSS